MGKHTIRFASMLLALVMVASLALTGMPMHAHAASDIVITVGPSGCDYTTINDALNAVSNMSRSSGQRAIIEIQPGNYEEMLYIDQDNITLRNASANPSIALKNKGVDIDANAVRITGYYGHGYNYYSMDSNYRYSASVLSSNKSKGSASTTNPGAGSATHWNATVVIAGDNFIAEDIIFENSFNQYVSAKAAADTIVKASGAKEGSTPRANLSKGSTAVQDKAYVERAAALAIKNSTSQASFDHCKFVGRQDTLYGGKSVTAAFYDCEIYGACDYIFGPMTAVFAKCELVFNTSENKNDKGYITAAQTASGTRGMLFYNCHVTSTTPGVDTASSYASKPGYWGRPWAADTGEAIFYYTVVDATCSYWSSQSKSLITPVGWLDTLKGESKLCGEYGTVELSGVDNSSSRESWATGVSSSGKLYDGKTIAVSTFLGSWNPFSGKDMTIVTDGSTIEPEEPTPTDAPSQTTAAPVQTTTSGGTTVPAGSYTHSFTANGKNSDFYTITGNTSTSKGSVTYAGQSLTTCLKMESATNITFNAPSDGTLTLVFGGSTAAGGKAVKVDGSSKTLDSNGILTMDITSGSHTVTKGDSINLFYMVYTPAGSSGGESGGTEETLTATGALNMSSVTVTKAAGAADPTSVDSALLSGLTMTVSYSNGTSKTVGLSELTISSIKTHDTMGKYIDVDYMDANAGKVHCYILVTIEESAQEHTHSYSSKVTTAATCATAGVRTYTCSCGASYTEAIPATGNHSYSNGSCTVCGAADPSYNPGGSVTSGSYIHNFTDDGFTSDFYTFAGSQLTNGKHGTYTYDFGYGTETLNYALKFDSAGSVSFTAPADGKLTIAAAASSTNRKVGVFDAAGNEIGVLAVPNTNTLYVLTVDVSANTAYTVKRTSNESGLYYIAYVPNSSTGGDVHTHSYTESITTAATCDKAGVKTFTCSCGDSYTEAIAALGHSYTSEEVSPNCTTDGYILYTCSTCGATYTEAGTASQGHFYENGTCTYCGATDPDYVTEWEDTWTTQQTSQFTLNTAGTVTFTMAGTVAAGNWGHLDNVRLWNTNGEEIALVNGDFESWADYTIPGWTLTEADYCSMDTTAKNNKTYRLDLWQSADSDVYVSVAQSVSVGAGSYYFTYDIIGNSGLTGVISGTESHTHSYSSSVTTAATCTTAGVRTYTCSCGASYTEAISALGHSYSSKVTAPTCTANGYTTYTCTNCGNSYTSNQTSATGHSYTSSVTAPTCTASGTRTYTCSTCGYSYSETIAATGHSYSNGTCTVCGAADPNAETPDETIKNGLAKGDDGNYYYYINNEVQWDYTGLIANSAGNWYILNGQAQLSYDGLITFEGTKYLIKAGHVNTAFTGITKQEGVYYYFYEGVNDLEFEGLVYCIGMKAYVQDGEV
ncbi:MAG: hypothetical protein IJN53_06370, partial [Oscillospiraceae bacterium]|nr:hypothetical protein [Oscillospiraceae bacterium]